MKIYRIESMKGGWFIGNFLPSVYRTKEFEVGVKHHKAGENWDRHYQKKATEINLLVRGTMAMELKDGFQMLTPGEIFVLEPMEVAKPMFYTDCQVVVVKSPSLPNDKVVVP